MNAAIATSVILIMLATLPLILVITTQNILVRLLGPYVFSSRIGKGIYYLTAVAGVPVHELSHCVAALIFQHKINKVRLFEFTSAHGRMGYVEHAWNSQSAFQNIGLFFIGIAPLLGAAAAIGVVTFCLIPNLYDAYVYTMGQFDMAPALDEMSIRAVFNSMWFGGVVSLALISSVMDEPNLWWWLILVSVIAFHSIPSAADLHNSKKGIVFIFLLFIAVSLVGSGSEWLAVAIEHWINACIFLSVLITLSLPLWALLIIGAILGKSRESQQPTRDTEDGE